MNSGILLINKEKNMTSHDVVNKVRRLFGTKQVGHIGTLDPDATGLLVVLVGPATKASDFLMEHSKKYLAKIKLGIETDTEDITGNIIKKSDNIPSEEVVKETINSFLGKYMQVPPMYSALKIDGKKLINLARKGIEVDRQAREVYIDEISCSKCEDTIYDLDVSCSKGTYIRTLCKDIGEKLGCGACMYSLHRTKVGSFDLDNSYTLSYIESLETIKDRMNLLLPIEKSFENLEIITFPSFYERLALNGLEIYQKKIGTKYSVGTLLRIYIDKKFFGLCEVKDYPDGTAIKIIKRF